MSYGWVTKRPTILYFYYGVTLFTNALYKFMVFSIILYPSFNSNAYRDLFAI